MRAYQCMARRPPPSSSFPRHHDRSKPDQRRRIAVGLSVKRVEKLMRAGVPGRHTDGDVKGLMLCVEGKKSAHWLLRYQRDKTVRHMGLGSARDLSLAGAREKAKIERERIARDI